jgi:DNA-binding HxlR family transcriptional regulator
MRFSNSDCDLQLLYCSVNHCQGGVVTDARAIIAAVDVLGDRWTLLILTDIILNDHRHFRALLTGSADGIASNILADRLVKLLDAGLLTRGTAMRGQRARYSLTEAGIRTVPVLAALGEWGAGGSGAADPDRLMSDLRLKHIGAPTG